MAQPQRGQTQEFVVDVGGGVNDAVDAFRLDPPGAAVAKNLVARVEGSLTKMNGSASVAALPAGAVLAAGARESLILGPTPARVIDAAGDIANVRPGAGYPFKMELHRVLAARGFVHDVQVAHAGGYTAVAYSILGDSSGHSNTQLQLLYDYQVEAVILDADMRIVWGPLPIGTLKWMPRVEPITASGVNGTPVFCVFAVTDPEPISAMKSPFSGSPQLDYARIDPSVATVGAQSSVGPLFPCTPFGSAGTADRFFKWWDTTSDLVTKACYVAGPFSNSGKELRALEVTESGSTLRAQGLTATTNDHMALWVDRASDTLLVYDRGDSTVWYGAASTMGALSAVAAPSLEGIDSSAANLLGLHEGDRPHTPEFYLDEDSLLKLNTRQVVLTGSAPGTPSFGTERSPWLPHAYRPFVVGGRLHGVYGGQGALSVYTPFGLYLRGASTLEVYHMENHGPDDYPTVDLPLFESRLGSHSHRLYMWRAISADPATETWANEIPMVTGQVATLASGAVLVPSAFLTAQQKNRNSLPAASQTFSQDNTPSLNHNLTILGDATDGAGYYNDEQVIGLAEIDTGVGPAGTSVVDIGSTRIVAAGLVSAWASSQVHPAFLRRPAIVGYHESGNTGARALHAEAVGVKDASVPPLYDFNAAFRLAVVLVFTDADGLEIRSEPSPFWEQTGVTGSADTQPTQCPVVALEMHPSFYSFFGGGRTIDAEVYVTERVTTDSSSGWGPADVDETTATMVCRMPVQKDANGFFVFDTLQDFAVRNDTTGDPVPWQSPPQTNALFTVTGELAPTGVPAMSILTQAGDYLFGIPIEDNNEIWVSKPLVRGRTAEFNPRLTISAPASGGGVVSLAGLYDRLVVICRNGVWELPVLGGPNALGAGAFPPPRLVYRGEECVGHAGTVATPQGVFYVTASGPRFHGGGQDQDVGRAVETRLAWRELTGSVYLPDEDTLVWATATGLVLFDRGVWTHSDLGASALGRIGSDLLRVRPDNALLRHAAGAYTDASTDEPIIAQWVSPWIRVGGPLSENRVQRAGFLLRLENTPTVGKLQVTIAYNYDPTVVETKEWTASELAALDYPVLQVTPGNLQQCAAIQFGIVDATEQVEVSPPPEQVLEDQNDLRWSIVAAQLDVQPIGGLLRVQQEAKR